MGLMAGTLLTNIYGAGRDNTRQALAIERDAAYEKVHDLEKMLCTMQQVCCLHMPSTGFDFHVSMFAVLCS